MNLTRSLRASTLPEAAVLGALRNIFSSSRKGAFPLLLAWAERLGVHLVLCDGKGQLLSGPSTQVDPQHGGPPGIPVRSHSMVANHSSLSSFSSFSMLPRRPPTWHQTHLPDITAETSQVSQRKPWESPSWLLWPLSHTKRMLLLGLVLPLPVVVGI